MFSYRVAEGKMGMNCIWNINNKKRQFEYLINGHNIYGKESELKGVYRFEDKLITWTHENGAASFVWVRPGI